MGEKLKNIAITPLPIVASTPSNDATIEEVPLLPLVSVDEVVGPSTHPVPTDSGYFLRSGKKVPLGGLGMDTPPVSRGRGRKYFLSKAQTRA